MKTYTLIEHTADIGIRTKGDSLKELFQNTALAMFDIIAGIPTKKSKRKGKITIKEKADNIEELFINWLNELLSLSAVKELIFTDFIIEKLDEHSIKSICIGEGIKNFKVNTEIKAATYHELKLERKESGWLAEIIFDV